MRRWPLRVLLSALILAGATIQLGAAYPSSDQTLTDVRSLLVQAGYRVQGSRESWLAGRIRGQSSLIARHPACRQNVAVLPVELDAPPTTEPSGVPQYYVYDRYEGRKPARLTILRIALGLELRTILSFGRLPKPPRTMLKITDPSACLALAAPDWRRLWAGNIPPA
jgi:hypothetical protein